MSGIFMIRHGQASFGRQNYDQLSDLGRRQSRVLGDYFANLGQHFDAAYSGSMNRQRETARIVLSQSSDTNMNPSVQIAPELNEYDSFAVMKSHLPALIQSEPQLAEVADRMYNDPRSFQLVFERTMLRWILGGYDPPEIETWRRFTDRVTSIVARIMTEHNREKNIAVFTSGGPIAVVMRLVLELSDEITLRVNWGIRNTSVSVFKYNEKLLFLSSYNSVAHLEQQGDPALLTYR